MTRHTFGELGAIMTEIHRSLRALEREGRARAVDGIIYVRVHEDGDMLVALGRRTVMTEAMVIDGVIETDSRMARLLSDPPPEGTWCVVDWGDEVTAAVYVQDAPRALGAA